MVNTMKLIMDLIFNLTRSAPAADSVFPESTLFGIVDKTNPFI
jgi:hypothetical protein